jgi:hypothetical protein
MSYEIIEVITDIGGKFRVRVVVDQDTRETMFFKFDHHPSQEEINETVNIYLNDIINMSNNE